MKNEEMKTFQCRAYGRSELAQMYFPETEPLRAWLRLRRWIQKNYVLRRWFVTSGANERRIFTPADVQKIVSELGEP